MKEEKLSGGLREDLPLLKQIKDDLFSSLFTEESFENYLLEYFTQIIDAGYGEEGITYIAKLKYKKDEKLATLDKNLYRVEVEYEKVINTNDTITIKVVDFQVFTLVNI